MKSGKKTTMVKAEATLEEPVGPTVVNKPGICYLDGRMMLLP